MRRLTGNYLLIFILVSALLGLPVLIEEAQARGGGRGGRGGGGGYRGGGMGGGGFQGAQRPSGGAGRQAGSVQRGDAGRRDVGRDAGRRDVDASRRDVTARQRDVNVSRNVNVSGDWHGGYGRYGYGVAGAVAVGATVAALSAAARPVVYGGTTYYVDGGTYYKQCYQGDEVAYCVVENPNP